MGLGFHTTSRCLCTQPSVVLSPPEGLRWGPAQVALLTQRLPRLLHGPRPGLSPTHSHSGAPPFLATQLGGAHFLMPTAPLCSHVPSILCLNAESWV